MIPHSSYRFTWFMVILGVLALSLTACGQVVNSVIDVPQLEAQATQTPGLLNADEAYPLPEFSTPTPTLSPTQAPTPTPAPTLRQLTDGGCCVEPFWSGDGRVLFLDRPADGPAGYWAVGLNGGAPELFTDRLGVYSPDMAYLAYPRNGQTIVERASDGATWVIPSGGREVSFSPLGDMLAWTGGQSGPPFDTARREVWVSLVDGSQARALFSVYGGGFAGWFPDGNLLVSGRLSQEDSFSGLWKLSVQDGTAVPIIQAGRLRGLSMSPGGSWLAYQDLFNEDPSEDGLWLVNVTTGERLKLGLFGGYRWRDDQHLLVIPLEPEQTSHQVWQVEAASGEAQPLTDKGVTPFKIANGDWSVSPDGQHIAFVSSADNNIWLLSLPFSD